MTEPSLAHERARLLRLAAESTRRICVEPEDITVTDWTARERILPETSTSPGPYDPSVVPYARRWHDLGADPSISRIALCWASQMIKSTVIEDILAYRIVFMPSPMIVVQPKIDAAEAWAKERFVPMVLATPALRSRIQLGRSSDSTLRYKRFPGGFLYVASAQSAAELAARSAPLIVCDEIDRMEPIAEGNPIEIVSRRQGAADIGLEIFTSTPGDAENTNIWPYMEGGTFELYHVRCPHCGQSQPLFWCNVHWDGQPAGAYYVCGGAGKSAPGKRTSPVLEAYLASEIANKTESGVLVGCGAVIDERWKSEMLAGGEWLPINPRADYPSSHLHGLYSPFAKSNWGSIATAFVKAQRKSTDLQVVINTRFAECWTETADVLKGSTLTERLETWDEGTVPDGVGVLTFGADVQGNRIEVYVWGWGAGLESWLIATHVLPGDPAIEPSQPVGVWADLSQVLMRTYRHVSGRSVSISAGLIDSGHETTKVYQWARRLGAKRIFASKGVSAQSAIIGKPTIQTKERYVLYPIGVDSVKTEFLRSQLLTDAPGPGYVHLPDWLTTDQCEQLVSEKRTRRLERGHVIYEWRKKHQDDPNEALDCRVYARAALEVLGSRVIQQLGAIATKLSVPPDPEPEPELNEDGSPKEPEPRRSQPRRNRPGGWMSGI